ncbi:hypothetical protein [Catenulispora rubra]|uniref:hypothetical protein n=1 Tax=Catenulispora rubra TaxID=280293 RepID=UPI0018926BAA|nr:hypothetical protein [Catenulispora rubra]
MAEAAQPVEAPGTAAVGQGQAPVAGEAGRAAEPRRRPAPAPAPSSYEPEAERMPLMARVLLADLAVAVVALVALFVIEVQRFGDATLHLRREAWAEDLVVLFGVSVVFGVVTYLLFRARHLRVAIVQTVVTALILAAAVTSAVTGDPKPTSADIPSTSTSGNPG